MGSVSFQTRLPAARLALSRTSSVRDISQLSDHWPAPTEAVWKRLSGTVMLSCHAVMWTNLIDLDYKNKSRLLCRSKPLYSPTRRVVYYRARAGINDLYFRQHSPWACWTGIVMFQGLSLQSRRRCIKLLFTPTLALKNWFSGQKGGNR